MALRLYFASVLFALPLLAQTQPVDIGKSEAEIREMNRAVNSAIQYCDTVDQFSLEHQALLFAELTSNPAGHSKWVEFLSRAEWERAGKPRPVASVTRRGGRVVRVLISFKDEPSAYASYCYTPEGKLARLVSGPRVRETCDDAYFRCELTLGISSFYSAEGRLIATMMSGSDPRVLKSERTSISWMGTKPPLYITISDLPFATSLH